MCTDLVEHAKKYPDASPSEHAMATRARCSPSCPTDRATTHGHIWQLLEFDIEVTKKPKTPEDPQDPTRTAHHIPFCTTFPSPPETTQCTDARKASAKHAILNAIVDRRRWSVECWSHMAHTRHARSPRPFHHAFHVVMHATESLRRVTATRRGLPSSASRVCDHTITWRSRVELRRRR